MVKVNLLLNCSQADNGELYKNNRESDLFLARGKLGITKLFCGYIW